MGFNHLNIASMEVITITPAMAVEMLKNNASNRPISMSVVKCYSTDMLNGDWCTTHQGIALNSKGAVVDGQHRLMAIVNSGCSVKMSVVRYDSDCTALMSPIDLQKRRTPSDLTGLSRSITESIGFIVRELNPKSITRLEARIIDFMNKDPELIEWYESSITKTNVKIVTVAPIRSAVIMAHIAGYEWTGQYRSMVLYDYETMHENTHALYKKLTSIGNASASPLFRRIAFGATYMVATTSEPIKIFKESSINIAWQDAKKTLQMYMAKS